MMLDESLCGMLQKEGISTREQYVQE